MPNACSFFLPVGGIGVLHAVGLDQLHRVPLQVHPGQLRQGRAVHAGHAVQRGRGPGEGEEPPGQGGQEVPRLEERRDRHDGRNDDRHALHGRVPGQARGLPQAVQEVQGHAGGVERWGQGGRDGQVKGGQTEDGATKVGQTIILLMMWLLYIK